MLSTLVSCISSGHVGRVMRRVTSHGLANAQDPAVVEQLRVKFPQRCHNLPISVPKVAAIESFGGLRESLLSLEPGTSPRSGGMRPEYLAAMGEMLEPAKVELLERFDSTAD